jgi:hypothetical protein
MGIHAEGLYTRISIFRRTTKTNSVVRHKILVSCKQTFANVNIGLFFCFNATVVLG